MITHFKVFENMDNLDSLKKGDYVLVTSPDLKAVNQVMLLTEDPEYHPDGFSVVAKFIDDTGVFVDVPFHSSIYDYEIVRKLMEDEAELYINANKYNL